MTTMAMAWQAKPKPKTKDSFEKAKLTICNRVQNDDGMANSFMLFALVPAGTR